MVLFLRDTLSRYAPTIHLHETVEELRKFNARRKLKGAVLAAVSSPKWTQYYDGSGSGGSHGIGSASGNGGIGANGDQLSQPGGNNNHLPSSAASASSTSDFGGDDEVTAAAVGLVLDSLDDIHCLLEAKNKDPDFLYSVLCDLQVNKLIPTSKVNFLDPLRTKIVADREDIFVDL